MPDPSGPPILEFRGVSLSFEGTPALNNVSFVLAEGDSCVVLGAAGSGKTVLLKVALGLVRPDSGSVRVFEQEITRMREKELFDVRSRMGMLFQEGALFDSMTIEENVVYPLLNQKAIRCASQEAGARAAEALRFVELERTLAQFPSELSGGMRRRAAIARAVVTRPNLVLYDSPTAGLDPITAHTIIALIVKERDLRRTTTLMVTHRYQDGSLLANFRYNPEKADLEPVSGARENGVFRTRFLVMREGQLVFEGDQQSLEASGDPYLRKFVRRYR